MISGMKTIKCILKKGKEKPLEGFHPWIFSGAIEEIDDSYESGDLVKVYSAEGRFLGQGYLNPRSQIAIRMLTFDEKEITPAFFEKRILEAAILRQSFLPPETTTYRLIHAEGDFLPGLIVDRYGDYLVAQFLTVGMDKWKDTIVQILAKTVPVRGIFERGDSEWREWEGLESRIGKLWGEEPPDFVEVQENGLTFIVDIHKGQKTGFFIDQRANRKLISEISRGKRVLNCFSYTAAFSVYAAKGGAVQTVSVDTSLEAQNTARENFRLNGLTPAETDFVSEDVFDYLRASRQEFDIVILDPPAFCKSKNHIIQASRGYKDINMAAMKRLSPGGLLYTASCSSHISPDLFQKIIFGAAKDVRRRVRIIAKTSHGFDHPINIYHPEGEYLKGLLCEVH